MHIENDLVSGLGNQGKLVNKKGAPVSPLLSHGSLEGICVEVTKLGNFLSLCSLEVERLRVMNSH